MLYIAMSMTGPVLWPHEIGEGLGLLIIMPAVNVCVDQVLAIPTEHSHQSQEVLTICVLACMLMVVVGIFWRPNILHLQHIAALGAALNRTSPGHLVLVVRTLLRCRA